MSIWMFVILAAISTFLVFFCDGRFHTVGSICFDRSELVADSMC